MWSSSGKNDIIKRKSAVSDEANIEYPKYQDLSKLGGQPHEIDRDMELMEQRMAENENRSKEALSKMKEDTLNEVHDTKLPSLERYGVIRKPVENIPSKIVNSSSPTKSDIELREMLKNPPPPKTPPLSDYLSDLCSDLDDSSTIRTLSFNARDTESESLDTLLNNSIALHEKENFSQILKNNNENSSEDKNNLNPCDFSSVKAVLSTDHKPRSRENDRHSMFLPIQTSSNESICQRTNEKNEYNNINLSRRLLERNLEKLIQEHRVSGQELISQLTNEMTESQLERLRRVTEIELSSPNINSESNDQMVISTPSCSYTKGDSYHLTEGCCQGHGSPKPRNFRHKLQSADECFRSPAIPRKTCAQSMIQSSYNVTPELFISRYHNRGNKHTSSRNTDTMERTPPFGPQYKSHYKNNSRNREYRPWKQNADYCDRHKEISSERENCRRAAHRSHSYRQSKRNDRLFSTLTKVPKEKRHSGHFFQYPIPKRNEGIQYYSPQPEKKHYPHHKTPTTSNTSISKGYPTSNTSSFYTDTYPVSIDYDYCSSCSTTSSSSSSSSSDDDDHRFSRRMESRMGKQIFPENKQPFEAPNAFPYCGGVRVSYLPNDRKRATKQKKMMEEMSKRNNGSERHELSHLPNFNCLGNVREVHGQPVLRTRSVDQRARMHRPMSEHLITTDGGCNLDNLDRGFAEATFREGNGNMNSLVGMESGTNIKKLRRKELKNKNCIVS